jgi:hypothetical protein
LQGKIGWLLSRPVGRPPLEVRRYDASYLSSAELEETAARRGEGRVAPRRALPRVGFIVTNLARPAERIVAFYNRRGTCEQYIKEG